MRLLLYVDALLVLVCLWLRSDLQFTFDVTCARHIVGLGFDRRLFFVGMDGAAQRDVSALRDDLDVLCVFRKAFILGNRAADLTGDFHVGPVALLLVRRGPTGIGVALVDGGVVRRAPVGLGCLCYERQR